MEGEKREKKGENDVVERERESAGTGTEKVGVVCGPLLLTSQNNFKSVCVATTQNNNAAACTKKISFFPAATMEEIIIIFFLGLGKFANLASLPFGALVGIFANFA